MLIVSGPSGAGKDTVIERLRKLEPSVGYCVTYTTRPPRQYEIQGVHYCFTTRDEFTQMDFAGQFIETFEYAGNLYGTPKEFVDEGLRAGRDLILKPEVNGARAIKARYPDAVLVFLTAPSHAELARRLEQRQADAPGEIDRRLNIAADELNEMATFDYCVVNDDIEQAVNDLRCILVAERLKVSRLPSRKVVNQR
jgi:guanylate kinase